MESVIDPVTRLPRLLNDQCASCVFRPGNLMHLRPGRLKLLIAENTGPTAHGLVCHETLSYGGHPGFTPAFCRGFYTKYGHLANYIRICERLGGFTEIDPPEWWLDVVGYDGRYKVSSYGNIKSIRRNSELMLKPQQDADGYLYVRLVKDGHPKRHPVHVLVLEAYVELKPAGMEARHLYGDPSDNRYWRLSWGTPAENGQDKIQHGTSYRSGRTRGSSRYRGVSWNSNHKKWRAHICVNGKQRYLGSFTHEDDAAHTRDAVAKEVHGAHAVLNFPNEATQ